MYNKLIQLVFLHTLFFSDCRNAALLWALHGYFVPTTKFVRKTDAGKNITTKFTIKDSQESFLFIAKCTQQIEDHIDHLRKSKKYIQPFIYCIGENIFSFQEIFIYFDDIRYKFFNILRAVDICFKIIYVFNLDFPPEAIMFYTFLESHFFQFKTQQCFPKVSILSEYLKEN